MIKTKETKRKFYNKWLYKATLLVPGVTIFRSKTPQQVEEFCTRDVIPDKQDFWNRIYRDSWNNKESILKINTFLTELPKEDFNIRIERNSIDIYVNDKKIYEEIKNRFESQLLSLFEPNQEYLNLLDQEKKIVCKKLPHNKYKYKVYLRPHKLAHDILNKTSYLNWLDTQSNHLLISEAVKKWFIETDWNWDRRYMYVEDKPTLLMLNLRNSEVLGQVYEYVTTDK